MKIVYCVTVLKKKILRRRRVSDMVQAILAVAPRELTELDVKPIIVLVCTYKYIRYEIT